MRCSVTAVRSVAKIEVAPLGSHATGMAKEECGIEIALIYVVLPIADLKNAEGHDPVKKDA